MYTVLRDYSKQNGSVMTDSPSLSGNLSSKSASAMSSMMASRISVSLGSSGSGIGVRVSHVHRRLVTAPSRATVMAAQTTPLARGSSTNLGRLYALLLDLCLPIPAEVQVGDAGGDQHDREEYDHEERLSQREPPRASVEDGLAHNWNRGEHGPTK